jgi:hypothetical protein
MPIASMLATLAHRRDFGRDRRPERTFDGERCGDDVPADGRRKGNEMEPTTEDRLSRIEFEQLSADEQSDHVEAALTALRLSIPHSGASAGAFIDVRLYVQELAGWAPTKVERAWLLHRAGIERESAAIQAAFQEALDSGSLTPAQAQYARTCLGAGRQLYDLADEYF